MIGWREVSSYEAFRCLGSIIQMNGEIKDVENRIKVVRMREKIRSISR